MKKGLKIGIIVGIIVLAILLLGGYLVVNDIMQKAKIVEEFSKIEELTSKEDFGMEELNQITNRTVTSGKYASVEKAGKKYATDLFNTAYGLKLFLQDEKMAQILTASNYQEDGPEFVESQKYLSETKQQLEEGKAKILAYIEENKINSYIEAETSDEYCIQLYRQLLSEDINMSDSEKKELETSVDKVIQMLDIEKEVLDFLIANKGKWQVEGEQVAFDSNSLVEEYNAFLTKLRIL